VVAASGFVPGSTTGNPTLKAGYYQKATVFVDANGNGVLDSGEASAVTDASGKFTLTTTATGGSLVADIGTGATNTATGAAVASHLILRASAAQIADQGAGKIVISPLSSEAQRLVEANASNYASEKANLVARLNGPAFNLGDAKFADPLADVNGLSGATQYAALYQDNELTNRYTYATAKLDRKDMFPDNLAVPGGDPRLVGLSGVTLTNTDGTKATPTVPTQKQAPITFAQAQQAAFNVEGVPAYDNIFVIIEENKSTDVIVGNSRAVNINHILNNYNQLSTYYSTGNPSEPNYTALGGGDDFGITDDNWFGCGAVGPYAVTDVAFAGGTASDGQPLPAQDKLPPADSAHRAGYSAASTSCGDAPTGGTVHNVPGANLFTLMSKTGRTIRTYSESMNPGQDVRADSIADAAWPPRTTRAASRASPTSTAPPFPPRRHGQLRGGGRPVQGQARPVDRLPGRTQPARVRGHQPHHLRHAVPGSRLAQDRGLQGAQRLGLRPVQQGPGHGRRGQHQLHRAGPVRRHARRGQRLELPGRQRRPGSQHQACRHLPGHDGQGDPELGAVEEPAQARGDRGDVRRRRRRQQRLLLRLERGRQGLRRRTGDRGRERQGDGHHAAPANYAAGNFGHGNSIFGIISNQQDVGTAKKKVADSDAYSHFSFVRTLQDMFQIADPAVDATYLNRAKYSEAFITANIAALPEYAGSADTHFDSVRPINHAYVIPGNYTQKLYAADIDGQVDSATGLTEGQITPQTGPDASQSNVWATK
jgi:hypothetical protein